MLTIDKESPIPIYHQLAGSLKKEIKRMPHNKLFYTEKKLTDKYSVSRHTAIKVINELVKEGLLYRQQGKGTYVKKTVVRNTNNIMLFIPHNLKFYALKENYILGELIQGVIDEVNLNGNLIMFTIPENVDETEFCIEKINNSMVDGVILMPYSNLSTIISIARNNGKPYVLLNVKGENKTYQYNNILADESSGVAQSVRHLVEMGHKRIGYIGYLYPDSLFTNRYYGYRKGLQENGMDFDESLTFDWNKIKSSKSFEEFFIQSGDATAIITGNDMLAAELMEYCHEAGISVPEQVSIIGFDDAPLAEESVPKLTTVNKPRLEMGREAARRMNQMINDGIFQVENMIFETRLVIRDTVTYAGYGIGQINSDKSD